MPKLKTFLDRLKTDGIHSSEYAHVCISVSPCLSVLLGVGVCVGVGVVASGLTG